MGSRISSPGHGIQDLGFKGAYGIYSLSLSLSLSLSVSVSLSLSLSLCLLASAFATTARNAGRNRQHFHFSEPLCEGGIMNALRPNLCVLL